MLPEASTTDINVATRATFEGTAENLVELECSPLGSAVAVKLGRISGTTSSAMSAFSKIAA